MLPNDIEKRIAEARADGKAFLLICVDTLDRIRGDADLGYYFPAFDTEKDVAFYLAEHQTGDEWNPSDARDWCETIIEIQDARTAIAHETTEWLDARR